MIRTGTAIWLGVVCVVGFTMFKVKYDVQELEEQLGRVSRAIATDQDAIHVLKAEWSFLSQPNRLTDLAKRHLELAPIGTVQLGTLEQLQTLPMRPGAAPAEAVAPVATAAPALPAAKPAEPSLAGSSTNLAQAKTRTLR
jgi:cell division protein FtsL